jgi:hypothetical protein
MSVLFIKANQQFHQMIKYYACLGYNQRAGTPLDGLSRQSETMDYMSMIHAI